MRLATLLLLLAACGGAGSKEACLAKLAAHDACNAAAGNPTDLEHADGACSDPFSARLEDCLAASYVGGNCIDGYTAPIDDAQAACYDAGE